ncbi:MAG: TetR/AcrR family transcriptional regulator [Acidimicrobiales bacterium]
MAPAPSRAPGTPAAERGLRTQGMRTMAKLLDAGMRVLAERGYQAARVDDVVRVARLSHGTFYLYFANKEDLFRALATECAEEMKALAGTLGPVDAGPAGAAELRRWLGEFLGTYRRYGAVIRAWMEDQVVDRRLVALGLDAFAALSAALEARVSAAGAEHLAAPGLATPAMLAMIERFAYFTSSRDLGVSDAVGADTLATMIHRGFFGAPAPTKRQVALRAR